MGYSRKEIDHAAALADQGQHKQAREIATRYARASHPNVSASGRAVLDRIDAAERQNRKRSVRMLILALLAVAIVGGALALRSLEESAAIVDGAYHALQLTRAAQ